MMKLIKIFMNNRLENESINNEAKAVETCDKKSTEFVDKNSFEQLIGFYYDKNIVKDQRKFYKSEFPKEFNKDEYFKRGRKVYESVMVKNYIKEIKVLNALEDQGITEIEVKDDKLEVVIYIQSSQLGIGTGLGVRECTTEQCEKFADVLAHELFHAENNIDIFESVGAEEYKSIRYSKDAWFTIGRVIFDEYCAYRKNAEKFNSFEIEISEDKIETIFNYLKCIEKDSNLIMIIKILFYNIAAFSALADVSNEKEELILEKLKDSKNLFQEVRELLNCFYLEYPLDYRKYNEMARKLEEIYNSYGLHK